MLICILLSLFTLQPSHAEYLVYMDDQPNTFAMTQALYGLVFFDEDPSQYFGRKDRAMICGKLSGVAIKTVDFTARGRSTKWGRKQIAQTPNPHNCDKIYQFLNGERKIHLFDKDRGHCVNSAKLKGLSLPGMQGESKREVALQNPTKQQLVALFKEHNPKYRNTPNHCFDDSRLSRSPSKIPPPSYRPTKNSTSGE